MQINSMTNTKRPNYLNRDESKMIKDPSNQKLTYLQDMDVDSLM
jgi:hypothetical protein